MNYTRPNDPNHEDKPLDWLNSALIFGAALSSLLENNVGVVVKINGDAFNPVGESDKVIVFHKDGQIHIDNFEQDLPEGTICRIFNEEI